MDRFFDLLVTYGPGIVSGLKYTFILTITSLVGSAFLGLVLAFGRLSRRAWLRFPATWYIEIMRGVPLLLVLFLVYFGLPGFGIRLSPVEAAIIAFSFNGAAYMAEIFRSGIQSVDVGQTEAAIALGMTHNTMMRRVILPQAVYVTLPPAANFGVDMLKATSLALVITVPEVSYHAYNAIAATFATIPIFIIASAVYLSACIPLTRGVHRLEKAFEAKR
jgi:cystine transport system permease protein